MPVCLVMHATGRIEQDVDGADFFRHRGDGRAVARPSNGATSDTPSLANRASPSSSMSVANNAGALACKGHRTGAADWPHRAPRLTNARLPFRYSPIQSSLDNHVDGFSSLRAGSESNPFAKQKPIASSLRSLQRAQTLRISMIIVGRADMARDVVIAGAELHGRRRRRAGRRSSQSSPCHGVWWAGWGSRPQLFEFGTPLLQLLVR